MFLTTVMNYKIIFSRNEVLVCKQTKAQLPRNHKSNIFYEHDANRKMLIYAIIKAESEHEALTEARKLVAEYTAK